MMFVQICSKRLKCFAWKNYLGQLTGSKCLGVIIRRKIILAQIFRVAIFLKAIVWGGIIRDVIIWGGGQLSKNRINSNMYMGFYHHFQTATTFVDLIPSFKYAYTSLKQSYKTPVKKDLMRIILFRTYKHLKLSVILYTFHFLIIFLIYQTVRSLPSQIESLCSEFCKWF